LKYLLERLLPVADLLLAPFVYPAAWLLKCIRRAGVQRMPASKAVLLHVGVFPIRRHYDEPQFDFRDSAPSFADERKLPGIDWNVAGQLEFLGKLTYAEELAGILDAKPADAKPGSLRFHFNNGAFESGDAEVWYQLIRAFKPGRIFEIGSGNSTLLAVEAIRRNRADDPAYRCDHRCIEPYEMPWLEKTGASVIRKKVEDLGTGFFSELRENDVLFIDSSHVIRPQGDVLFEYLELLPSLNRGVIVHVHDIFSPRNYPREWLEGNVRFWNEQYLLEAFLSDNDNWKILGALNYLRHNHYAALKSVAPYLTPEREPGSLYLQKTG
jgi:hypothetical protein